MCVCVCVSVPINVHTYYITTCVCKFLVFSLEMKQTASKYTIESVLSSIHCYRCHNHIELIAIVNILSDFIKQHNQVITLKLTHGEINIDEFSARLTICPSFPSQQFTLSADGPRHYFPCQSCQ